MRISDGSADVCSSELVGSWRGLIEAVRIVSDLRGQRLGERMILWAVDQCRARDCKLVQLTSSASRTDAHRFSARLGFRSEERGVAQECGGTCSSRWPPYP